MHHSPSPDLNLQVRLACRPKGRPVLADFQFTSEPLPIPADGQLLVRHEWLSLDPYMRGRMADTPSYAPPLELGAVMLGGTVGVVQASKHSNYAPGDLVLGMGGWQAYSLADAQGPAAPLKLERSEVPAFAYLGALGMPGITAWYGLTQLLRLSPGQTLLVSGATGAVGSVVGQLARARGLRAVGLAGGAHKCAHAVQQLGYEACVDYRDGPDAMLQGLRQACPDGVQGIFENVGGALLDAALQLASPHARIALCGAMAGYNGEPIPLAAPQLLLTKRIGLQGFIITEHLPLWPQARQELLALWRQGQLQQHSTIVDGLEQAPEAFIGMLQGQHLGKLLVRLT
ncbi:NADP-dependent oxidoreductase [Roseateles sp. BYS180W]|uniref:NADP-dependent oxidoreductase n=1 Tax=Roseateles rivi TaxID=3299028 RepID=A0ABW7FSG7_9BURK